MSMDKYMKHFDHILAVQTNIRNPFSISYEYEQINI